MVSSLVDWMNDMGGPRGWKSMGHNVVKQVFYMDYYDFGILFEGFTFQVLIDILGLVGFLLKDGTIWLEKKWQQMGLGLNRMHGWLGALYRPEAYSNHVEGLQIVYRFILEEDTPKQLESELNLRIAQHLLLWWSATDL